MQGILTQKQMWRRQSWNGIQRGRHDFLYKEGISSDPVKMTRSVSDNSHASSTPNNLAFNKPFATTGSLCEPKTSVQTSTKKVRFNAAVRVVLIPTVSEYRQVGLGELMWWEDNNYKSFKHSALNELKLFMLKNSSMDSKAAIKALYQPAPNSDAAECSSGNSSNTTSPTQTEHKSMSLVQPNLIKMNHNEPSPMTARSEQVAAAVAKTSAALSVSEQAVKEQLERELEHAVLLRCESDTGISACSVSNSIFAHPEPASPGGTDSSISLTVSSSSGTASREHRSNTYGGTPSPSMFAALSSSSNSSSGGGMLAGTGHSNSSGNNSSTGHALSSSHMHPLALICS